MNKSNSKYLMPAEWEPHEAVWLAWPYDEITFPDRVESAEDTFVEMIKALEGSERVELLVLDDEMKERVREKLASGGVGDDAVEFRATGYADVWLRDTGPVFVRDGRGRKIITKWIFNAWGDKFPELLKDGEIPGKISRWKDLPLVKADAVVEGGAIDVNGAGVCLTTEQCLLNENRNPGMTKGDIERFLGDFLGVRKTIWLGDGLLNDHTDLETKVAQLTEMEHRGDELFHELSRRLNATFVTPIDREDIHAMGSSMDDVLDLIQGSATRMQMFQCGDVKPCLLEMSDIMVECSGILRQGIKRLPKFQDLSDLRKPLKALESRGDRINRQAVADLFSHCQTVADIVDLIKWKEVIENVEDAIDKFEDVFDVIENVVVKHA